MERAERAAVIADVHGNATAFEAVIAELVDEDPDLVVFNGDIAWGPEPEATIELLQALDVPAVFVRGNSERILIEYAARIEQGERPEMTEREEWLVDLHRQSAMSYLSTFVEHAVVQIDGLGPVRFCHGSPRSDEELITPKTPSDRFRDLSAGISERVLVSAHTHLQFDRVVAGRRSVNAGSVGMPYAEKPGAYWALLGPDVELRRTDYNLSAAVRRYQATADPLRERMVDYLLRPPQPNEVIEDAEQRQFAG